MIALALLAAAAPAPASPDPKLQLVWSDEFDGKALDAAKWELSDNCWGGGNRNSNAIARTQPTTASTTAFWTSSR